MKTYELWNEFDSLYKNHSFKKVDENGYEVRFFDEEKSTIHGKDIHIGFLTETTQSADGFSTIALPETEYAVFDILVAKGYDSGNAEMDKWLADNPAQYKQRLMDGMGFVVLCYNEKFKTGEAPDSVVEIWIPMYKHIN
ncbi:MAG: GyrI-like domain-containing protein [Oscillospiraceae bacterium]|nr:GyrI-like domain-containing protein [Oscillospiraceae bacterium]